MTAPELWTAWPPPLWLLLLDLLAVYRLTRLVVKDAITQPARRWLTDRYSGGALLTLLTCHWCLSVWAGAGVVALTWAAPLAWSYAATVLAASAAAGWLADREH